MNNNRWLIIIGMIIIIGMLVTAAFALGVSVGKNGWGNSEMQGPPVKNPQPPDPQQGGQNRPTGGQQTPQDGPNIPPGRPQIVGKLRELSDERLLLAAQNGLREITITPDTRFITDSGDHLEFADLVKGNILGVFGHFIPNDGGVFLADIVIRLPPKP